MQIHEGGRTRRANETIDGMMIKIRKLRKAGIVRWWTFLWGKAGMGLLFLWQCNVMLSFRIILIQCISNHLQMIAITQKIGIGCIYKQCFDIMLFDIIRIGFLYVEQVGIRYLLFVGPVSFFNIGLQFFYRSMQVTKQIWLYQLLMNNVK